MPKIFPVVVKRVNQQVGNGSANASWTDTEQLADPVVFLTDMVGETVDLSEASTHEILADPETLRTSDVVLTAGSVTDQVTIQAADQPVIQFPQPETVQHSDLWVPTLVVVESGQFADDPWSSTAPASLVVPDTVQTSEGLHIVAFNYLVTGDTYLDQASASTAHGSSTPLQAKGASTVPGSDEKRAYLMFDLTKFAGFSGDPSAANGLIITFNASTSNALIATTLTLNFRSGTTQPFVESTATWTSSSSTLAAYGTSRSTQTKSIATGAAANYSVGLSPSQASSCLTDGWLLITYTTAGGAAPDTVSIASREDATHFPTLQMNLVR